MPKLTSARDIIKQLAQQSPVIKKLLGENRLKHHWTHVVGSSLASKTEPDRVQGQTLWIRTQHPAWGQELQFHQSMILKKLGELDGRWAKVKEIRFFQRSAVLEDERSELDQPERPLQTCTECGYVASASLCGLCRSRIEEEERRHVYQLLQQRPWWRWGEVTNQVSFRLTGQDEFERLRRQYMSRLKDELRQFVFEFTEISPNAAKRAKAQKTAYFYATMKLACAPEQLTESALKGALGRWRYEAIFKTK